MSVRCSAYRSPAPFWGRMGDRYGNRLMMVRALAGLAITQLLIAFAQDVWTILALRFLQGAFAGYIAPAQAYGVQVTGGRDRAGLFAWLQVATNVGSLGGAFLGGLILDELSFAAINLTAGVICAPPPPGQVCPCRQTGLFPYGQQRR